MAKGKVKGCAFTGFCVGPDTATVPGNNSFNRCQAYAGALKFVGAVQAFKHLKKFIGMLHVEPGAIILNIIYPAAVPGI